MKNGGLRARLRREHLVVAYVVLAVAGLIAVRATVGALDFISVGWILVLAALPLLPWIVPQLGEFLKTISPYVQSLKLGGLQLDLREISRPVMIPSTGILANVPNDVGALSTSTGITELLAALREFRNKGAGPVVVIDLRDGHKWRLPNLYFLVRLLEIEPVVSELVFTEIRGGTDGHVVGTCSPGDFRRQVEAVVPGYAAAASTIQTPVQPDLHDMNQAQQLGASFSVLERPSVRARAGTTTLRAATSHRNGFGATSSGVSSAPPPLRWLPGCFRTRTCVQSSNSHIATCPPQRAHFSRASSIATSSLSPSPAQRWRERKRLSPTAAKIDLAPKRQCGLGIIRRSQSPK